MTYPEREQRATGSIYATGQRVGHPSTWPQPAPPPRQRRRSRLGLIAGIVAAMLVGGAGVAIGLVLAGRTEAGVAGAPSLGASRSSAPTRPASAASTADQATIQACTKLDQLYAAGETYDPDKLQPIGELALKSSDTSMRIQGQLLLDRISLARAAKGQSDELERKLGMAKTATELLTYCTKSGYVKP